MDNTHGGPLAVALHDLQHIFGERLHAFVAYGEPNATPAPSLALVSSISADDLEPVRRARLVLAPRRLRHAADADAR